MLDGGKIAPLIEADDVDKWVQTILCLANDPDTLAGLRDQIFSHIRKPHFSRQTFTERITSLLDSQPAR
jgi:glycosyltransferase involved in cell wall biosynthesis